VFIVLLDNIWIDRMLKFRYLVNVLQSDGWIAIDSPSFKFNSFSIEFLIVDKQWRFFV